MNTLSSLLNFIGNKIGGYDTDIPALQSDVGTAQGNITTMQGSITTMQGNITSLQTSVATLSPKVYQVTGASGTMPLPAGTITQITLTTASIEIGDGYSISSGGIQVSAAGKYRVTGSVYEQAQSQVTEAGVYVRVGSAFATATELCACKEAKPTSDGMDCIVQCSKIIELSANDIVFLAGRVIGGTGTVYTNSASTFLQLEKIA